MGFIANQLANVIEWADQKEGMLFWKWQNQEIKKGSKLIIRPGQDAIFLYNGKCEGVFEEEGNFDLESDIIPFLTTLKSCKCGFNTPLRAEVLFINTLEQLVKWGTKNAINLQAPGLPGGMPVRAFGTFSCKIADHDVLIDRLAGVRASYSVELKLGITITEFNIESFNYPEEIRKMQEKAAGQAMVGDVNKYTQMAMADSFGKGGSGGGSIAADMASMQMGMVMGQQMMQNMGMVNNAGAQGQPMAAAPAGAKFCPNCGTPTNGAKFCSNCGTQLA